jgi:Ser/Thr protein kinase RdoA (MazF antagonist)
MEMNTKPSRKKSSKAPAKPAAKAAVKPRPAKQPAAKKSARAPTQAQSPAPAAETPPSTTPYAGLTPDAVLNALESVGWRGDGRMLGMNSYENRVYQLHMEDGPPLVAKFYRPGRWSAEEILEEHGFVHELDARELPVVPALPLPSKPDTTLGEFNGFYFSVFPRRGGRAPELEDRETLEWMGRFIGRIHAVGALRPYEQRPVIDLDSFGDEPRNYIEDSGIVPPDLFDAWLSAVDRALEGVERCYERADEDQVRLIRLHGDCHAGTVLWTELAGSGSNRVGGPHFVDFDDSRMGPAIQDLWMLLSGDRASMTKQLTDVLKGYEEFHDFDKRELHLIEALRTLRLIHYSAWIARRWDDPAFPAAFPWFNTERYWQDRILELKEQIALMDEEPLRL